MDEVKLDVEVREKTGTREVKKVRKDDFIPAVVYGGEKPPTSVKVNRREFEKIMRHHHGQSVVFHLNVMQEGKKLRDYSAIVKDEQLHPVRENLLHLDFQRISLTEELEVDVQVELTGEAVGVTKEGGSLDHQMWELNIICLPTNIPEKLTVDVSELGIGDSVHVKDIPLPQGVRTEHDPEGTVATVVPPMKEEEPEEADEDAEPEVIGEKKDDESAEEEKEGDSEEKSEEKPE